MSVVVSEVTRRFGRETALDRVSLEIREGTVTGLAGPNGAGKSTLMRVLCGLERPDSGDVLINGMSVRDRMQEIRRILGYLPEDNPLYPEMYVREYLEFCAGWYPLPNRRQRVEEVMAQTGLGQAGHKIIGTLSKGYRQRVGLAQALVHNPRVLVLDEPMTGLDPNQMAEMHALISELGRERTMLLSSHNLHDLEALCGHFVLMHQGRIQGDETLERLRLQNISLPDWFYRNTNTNHAEPVNLQ